MINEYALVDHGPPHVAAGLAAIVGRFTALDGVRAAVLATGDGLPLIQGVADEYQIAALTGFVSATVQQASVALGFSGYREVQLIMKGGQVMVCRQFSSGPSTLLLTVILEQSFAYRRSLNKTIRALQSEMEKYSR